MKIRWIGQSGYVLSDEHTTIYIDPYLSDCVNRMAGRRRMVSPAMEAKDISCDAIICTHNHLDHLDVDLIKEMNKDDVTFCAPLDCEETLLSLGVKDYISFKCGKVISIGKFRLEAVYAKHTVPAVGVVVTYNGKRLYFTGDTLYDKKLENIKCDILFVCINGKLGNMNVCEAIKLTKKIQPRKGIPNHYGMFESNTENPRKYTDNVEDGFIMEYNKEYEMEKLI